jgi:transglutaminase-like putative cysteine protease
MNIPARYCTGYLGDIGIPPPYGPMDFAAWMEVYLGGARHVAISNTFGPAKLLSFAVVTDEIGGTVAA